MTFDRDTALEELERIQGRVFNPLPSPKIAAVGNTGLPADIPLGEAPGNGIPTITVAASNAYSESIKRADILCDGTADDVQIQLAFDTLPAAGGRVVLTEGTYDITANVTFPNANTIFQGLGAVLDLTAGFEIGEHNGYTNLYEVTGFVWTQTTQAANNSAILRAKSGGLYIHGNRFVNLTCAFVHGSESTGWFGNYTIANNFYKDITFHRSGGSGVCAIFTDAGAGSRAQSATFTGNFISGLTRVSTGGGQTWSVVKSEPSQGDVVCIGNFAEQLGTEVNGFVDTTHDAHNWVNGAWEYGDHSGIAAPGIDSTAIHDNVANEITAVTPKTAPVPLDELIMEDSEAGFVKKAVALGDLITAAIRTAVGPDASDYWNLDVVDGGDSFIFQQWDDSAAAFIERIEIIGKGTGLTNPGDVILRDESGVETARWDQSAGTWIYADSLITEGTIWGVDFRTRGLGVDAGDQWVLSTGASGDTFVMQQWDDSASAFIERLVIIGKGTTVTDEGDFIVYDLDGNELVRFDESADFWEYSKSIDMQGSNIFGVALYQTSSGPDAGDVWKMEVNNAGDSFVIRDFDTSGVGNIDRFEIIGKGTAVTDEGDIIFKDVDGVEVARWDDSARTFTIVQPTLIDQASTTSSLPVITLDQADVDEDFFKFIGTSDTSVDRALVDAVNFSTPGAIAGWLKVNIQDDQGTDPITDGDYYVPFYQAPSA